MAGKILKLFFIFLFLVLWGISAWAAVERPQYYGDQKSLEWLEKRRVDATYNTDLGPWATGVFKNPFIQPAPSASPFFDTVGMSFYETDSNDRLQRQINRSSLGYVHAVYTKSENTTQTPRRFHYSAWLNTGVQSASDIQVSDILEEGRGGFGGVTTLPDGRAVVFYHRSFGSNPNLNIPERGSYIEIEAAPGAGTFTNNEFHAPDSVGPPKTGVNGKNGLLRDSPIWPDAAAQKYKDTNFVHLVSHEGGTAAYRYMLYVRAKIDPSIDPNFFLWGKPFIFDTSFGFIPATVVASQQSAKVALIFTHPRNGFPSPGNTTHPESLATDADLYYIESTTGGDDWQNGFNNDTRDTFVNITKYTDSDPNRAWGDLSAAYDEQDSLVVAFSAPIFIPLIGASATQGSIFFWRRGIGGGPPELDKREVYNYSIDGSDLRRTHDALPVSNPHVGVYKGTAPDSIGDYYIIWTMGAGNDTTENNPPPLEGFWNYDIYCSATTNLGFSWSAITNITNSATPACTVGVCDHDQYASLARDINDTLHIRYRNDKVGSTGPTNTVNDTSRNAPIYYLKVKAKSVQKDTLAALNPNLLSGFKFDDGVTSDTFVFLANAGNQALTVNSIVADNPNASVTVTPYGAPPFNIPEGGAPAKVFLTFNGAGPNTPCSSYTVRWNFNTNAENSNLSLSPGNFQVKAQFALSTSSEPHVPIRFLDDLSQILETPKGMRMNISNVGTLSGGIISRTGMNLPQADSGIHFLSRGGGLFGAMMNTGDTLVARMIPGEDETEYRALAIPGATSPPETIQVKDTTYSGDLSFNTAIGQGRPGKGGSWQIVRYNYAIDLFNDPQNFPDLDSIPPWPGHWLGYRFQDEFWFKNDANYNWGVWYRKKFKTGAPCWWPEWPGAPTFTSQIYDGIAMDWDPSSDSASLGTTGIIFVNSTAYNDTFKFVYARGRGVPHNTRYAAQVFLVDTTMHFKGGDTVCVGNNCNVDPCSLSMSFPDQRMFGAKSISYESFIEPYGGFRTKELWELLSTPGYNLPDTMAFKQNKQDLILVTTHACCDPTEDTVAYAVGLAVTYGGIDTLKKSINEMRFCVGLDTIPVQSCIRKPGNANGDVNQAVNLTDIIFVVNKVFKGGPASNPVCATNANGDGTLANLVDIVYLVNYVFKGGLPPIKSSVCCL
ncbi:MAG: hypothetical protein A2V73_03065 [candidate division Zixibacteria bacterium RBG_19FT_COMBO_42_43]|nr:MAG: hypothetical protein A2V73_03065 [candidate division Zixibacteria bacterium RBG_19FT_COMBO_42_43]